MKAVEVKSTDPVFGESFYRIYHYNDLLLYQSQYFFDSSVHYFVADSSTDEESSPDTVLLSETRNRFFIFHKDSSYGYSYDAHDPLEDQKRLKVDSMLSRLRGLNELHCLVQQSPDSSSWNKNRTILHEVYLFPATDTTPSGRIVMEYSKNLKHVQESLNQIVDSIKGMKFIKWEYHINEYYDKKNQRQLPSMVLFATELREIDVENPKEIISYFNKYKEQVKLH